MFETYEYIVVGAGLFGCVVAEQLATKGHKVCILEKRKHLGGNCYDEYDRETGILYHTYGPHIFNTTNIDVVNYLKKFTKFTSYFHRVMATYKNKVYQLPINLSTINSFYNENLAPYEVKHFLSREIAKEQITIPQNMEEKAISLVGRPLYEAFIKEYTRKQWGQDPKELPSTLISRLPIRDSYYDSYYNKSFQGLPDEGYTAMFKKMLSSNFIDIRFETDFFKVREQINSRCKVVYTGPIDKFFDYQYGRLGYRSVTFKREIRDVPDWQGVSVMNYPELTHPYTRICEPKHFYRGRWDQYSTQQTLIIKELPSGNMNDSPYYPMIDHYNTQLFEEYKREASKLKNVFFGGRLGSYRYCNMDETIEMAFSMLKKLH